MIFWDASALVPLVIEQPASSAARALARARPSVAYWWGSVVECWSAFARLRREGVITREVEARTRSRLQTFLAQGIEILPSEEVRVRAGALLQRHDLWAADALQLAAALVCFPQPGAGEFLAFDRRLSEVALMEGLAVLPSSIA